MLTERFDAALLFAAALHKSQTRKGGQIPYLSHLLAVAALVLEDGGSEDEAIAGLLHDSIEDQGSIYPGGRAALRDYIRDEFGVAVAHIVKECTDDEGFEKHSVIPSAEQRELWWERKRKYAKEIAHKTPPALRVTAADKVHNAESILDSHAAVGPKVWNRFRTKSRQDQIDVYRDLSAAITARNNGLGDNQRSALPKRLVRAVLLMEQLA